MPVPPNVRQLRQRVALNVRRLRVAADLTQDQLAERAGLATRHLQKLEAGTVNATFKTVAALAEGLRVDAAELFTETNKLED